MTDPSTQQTTNAGGLGTLSDEQLAERVRGGCVKSYEQLDKRFRPRLVYLMRKRTGSREDAEDLTQQALLRAYQQIDKYNPKHSFRAWLFTIAIRMAIDAFRKRGIDAAAEGIERAQDPTPGPAETVSRMDTQRRLWALADKVLDPVQRTALWLHYGEDLKTKQIAKTLGLTAVHVRVLLYRARRTMMTHLEETENKTEAVTVPEPAYASTPPHASTPRKSRLSEGAVT